MEELTWQQLKEWLAFMRIEPFGPALDRAYAGTISASIYNVNKKQDAAAISWKDIFPPYQETQIDQAYTVEQWAEFSMDEREQKWEAMTKAQRDAFLQQEAEAVISFMHARTGEKIHYA